MFEEPPEAEAKNPTLVTYPKLNAKLDGDEKVRVNVVENNEIRKEYNFFNKVLVGAAEKLHKNLEKFGKFPLIPANFGQNLVKF